MPKPNGNGQGKSIVTTSHKKLFDYIPTTTMLKNRNFSFAGLHLDYICEKTTPQNCLPSLHSTATDIGGVGPGIFRFFAGDHWSPGGRQL